MENLTLVTSKITKKSWIKNNEGERITPKFRMEGYPARLFGDFVYITVSSIGELVFHKHQEKVLLMEYEDRIRIQNFCQISDKLYLACVSKKYEFSTDYLLYNHKGEFLGKVYGNNAAMKVWDDIIMVVKDDKIYLVDRYANVICEPNQS